MTDTVCKLLGRPLGNTRILGIADVAEALGTCPATASKIIDETGKAIMVRRKKYVLESTLVDFLREKEVEHA